ncbi:NAD-dependent epimerase/dehydratase family protein [Flavobacterium sp. HBTb2-11-1]|uniref:NAD-dependent epimerase/dehydratase family protein n=1 Tax=Flavobacterium sp. HBTb2-11-1 TaxID=2692212 RepID=UPI00136F9C0F|nr:NAD-dependent epimerase/dehydratase family protein [Flavobacterium sp. HBTb2-11-1]MXO06005.1 NAD-dependent epimerase/dehydratase family protein [Flavobacterium sp. HBTb2-11-1]
MKIAITGIRGFVGKNLQKYLETTYKIVSISARYELDQKFEISADALIHLAGKAHDLKKVSEPKEYFDANYELTKQLFDAFLDSESFDFIYFSSVKSVADSVQDVLFEDENPDPKSPYGQSKLNAENYILSKKISQGKRVFIIRPCMIHGPGNKGNLNLLFNVVKKGMPYPLAAFHNERSFLGIDNLNFLIKEILENKEIPSGIYNFSDDEFLSTNDVVRIISSVLNKKDRLIKIPKGLIIGMAKIGDFIKFPLNSETIQKLTENYRVSNRKIKSAIGIEKLPYTAKQGLEKTIKSFIEK